MSQHLLAKHFELVLKTQKQGMDKSEMANHAVWGLLSELGEVADLVKKHRWHDKSLDLTDLTKELGDMEWYMQELYYALGIDRSEAIASNITKVEKRHPTGFQPLYDSTKE